MKGIVIAKYCKVYSCYEKGIGKKRTKLQATISEINLGIR